MNQNGFSHNSINQINRLYYSHQLAFTSEMGLADIYSRNASLNRAIGSLLEKNIPAERKNILIKELCGGSVSKKWNFITERLVSRSNISVTLSDYSPQIIDVTFESFSTETITYKGESYNLLDDMKELGIEEKLDAILITYGFDSVWMDEDFTLRKEDNRWYQLTYRIGVPKELSNSGVVEALKTGILPKNFDILILENLVIERNLEQINIKDIPYFETISQIYSDIPNAWINFPGGMIKKTIQAFNMQLKDDGIFVIGDVVRHEKDLMIEEIEPYSTSGRVAKFKTEDYLIAKAILENYYGLSVNFLNLGDLIGRYLTLSEIQKAGSEIAIFGFKGRNSISIVSRKNL